MFRDRPSRWRAAWTAGRLAGRRVLGREVGERDSELGELLTGQLDQMKGLPMKLGQIVSYMDVPLPAPVQARLSALQTGSHGLDAEATRAALEAALGGPLHDYFEQFDLVPIAAASIGQVHRAVVGGRSVAVKLQYPGVADTFTRDLSLVRRLASLASLASAVDGRSIVEELEQRLVEECDYRREADMQRRFAAAFVGEPGIYVPAVMGELCGPTLLTSAWVDGDSFADLEASGSRARIDAAGQLLVRFSYRSLLNLALIQADPHPGNFLFEPDGRVAFLDFGCVRELGVELVEAVRDSLRAVRDHDRAAFARAVGAMGVVGKPRRFDYDHFFAVMEHLYRPLVASRFQFCAEYVREGMAYNGPSNPNARAMAIPPAYVWVMRLQWGLWSILSRLEASGSFRPILDQALAEPVEPAPAADEPGASRQEVRA